MDLKSGCAFEAGLEPHAQERGCYETRCLKNWENKSFFDQNKNKRNFQRRFNKENYNNPSNNNKTIFNYYTRQKKSTIIITNKFPSPGIPYPKENLITTRPQAPRQKPKKKLIMKKLCKNVSSIQRVY